MKKGLVRFTVLGLINRLYQNVHGNKETHLLNSDRQLNSFLLIIYFISSSNIVTLTKLINKFTGYHHGYTCTLTHWDRTNGIMSNII